MKLKDILNMPLKDFFSFLKDKPTTYTKYPTYQKDLRAKLIVTRGTYCYDCAEAGLVSKVAYGQRCKTCGAKMPNKDE